MTFRWIKHKYIFKAHTSYNALTLIGNVIFRIAHNMWWPSHVTKHCKRHIVYFFMKALKLKSDQKMLHTKRFLPLKRARFFSIHHSRWGGMGGVTCHLCHTPLLNPPLLGSTWIRHLFTFVINAFNRRAAY